MVGSSNKGKMVLPRRYLLGGGTAMLFNYTGDILGQELPESGPDLIAATTSW